MTSKHVTDVGLLAAAGALVAWGSYEGRRETLKPKALAGFAVLGGYALAIFGAYRLHPVAGAALGVGLVGAFGVNQYRADQGKATLPLPWVRLDLGDGLGTARSGDLSSLKADVRDAVLTALKKETDPAMLRELADKLRAAGHRRAADRVTRRATEVAPDARVGQAPSVVSEAQARLSALGYEVAQDGVLGPRTVLALKRFQSLHDLDIDGALGADTIAALRAAAP